MTSISGVSVVICTYNGAHRLPPTLEHILAQNVPDSIFWELIVVDNHSTDNTYNFCHEFLHASPVKITWRVVQERISGLSAARKTGVLNAAYDLVIFCDDDNYLDPEYVVRAFTIMTENPQIGILGGQGVPQFESSKPDWFDSYAYTFAVGPQGDGIGPARNSMVYGAGMTLRKKVLISLFDNGYVSILSDRKGSDLVSGGDNEICLWYQHLGYEVWYDSSLGFTHAIPADRATRGYLLKRAYAKGKTESIFLIYYSALRKGKVATWVDNSFLWYFELVKRLCWWMYYSVMATSFDYRLKKEVLISSIKFRLYNRAYIKEASTNLLALLSRVKKQK